MNEKARTAIRQCGKVRCFALRTSRNARGAASHKGSPKTAFEHPDGGRIFIECNLRVDKSIGRKSEGEFQAHRPRDMEVYAMQYFISSLPALLFIIESYGAVELGTQRSRATANSKLRRNSKAHR